MVYLKDDWNQPKHESMLFFTPLSSCWKSYPNNIIGCITNACLLHLSPLWWLIIQEMKSANDLAGGIAKFYPHVCCWNLSLLLAPYGSFPKWRIPPKNPPNSGGSEPLALAHFAVPSADARLAQSPRLGQRGDPTQFESIDVRRFEPEICKDWD